MAEKVDKIMEFVLEQREVGRRVCELLEKDKFSSEQYVLQWIKQKKKPEYCWKNRGGLRGW
jgi:hypothetical protein